MERSHTRLIVALFVVALCVFFIWQGQIPRKGLYLEKIVPYHRAVIAYHQKTGRIPESLDDLKNSDSIVDAESDQITLSVSNHCVVLRLLDRKRRVLYQMDVGPLASP